MRTRRLPALLIPCSRSLLPLSYGVGVRPARAATSRRFRKRRQPKNSMTKVQELTGPIPGSLRSWATCAILVVLALSRSVFSLYQAADLFLYHPQAFIHANQPHFHLGWQLPAVPGAQEL